ncbi:tRNA (adenosine(37)-N6)-dimethylallyltransferase MiaA [Patescibacteria group bacterium]|nr:MAG: tRNA (adenosine(37)-N6)-dimethylallyltransferase MiaA [Patescibacteria group bacterium]
MVATVRVRPSQGSDLAKGPTSLVVVVGPTASGKSALAMQFAQRFNGEIIAADSRTIYRGMDIGTAKPAAAEQKQIRHHLLDVVDPDQPFSAADFQEQANQAIANIQARGKLPIMVGGTGLYVDSVIYNYSFKSGRAAQPNPALVALSLAELQARAEDLGISLNHSDWHNPRRLIRAIEANGQPPTKQELRPNTLILGMSIDMVELEARIATRVNQMVEHGLLNEVEALLKRYQPDSEAMTGIGYRSFAAVAAGQMTVEQAIDDTVKDTKRYAKRQMTWFKRNSDIRWAHNQTEAEVQVSEFLAQAV